jgi:DNA-binding PadR family transcriptional regulator
MMTRRRVNNPLALAVMGCLIERPMHPYEISSTLRDRGKEASIKLNYGSLYAVVEALQKHKLIEPQQTLREGRRPERTVYTITPAGREEFEDWLAELLSTPTKEYTALEAGLSLMPSLPPDEVARLLDGRAERLRIELGSLGATHDFARQRGLPELFLVESLYRQAMITAELDFVAALARDIRSSSFGGTKAWRRMHELAAAGMTFAEIFADPVGNLGEEARALAPPDESS